MLKEGRDFCCCWLWVCVSTRSVVQVSPEEKRHIHSGARRFLTLAFYFSALAKPVALAIHLEDVDVMGQSVEGGAGEAF